MTARHRAHETACRRGTRLVARLVAGGLALAFLGAGRCHYHAHSCHGRDCDEEHASAGGGDTGAEPLPELRALLMVDFATRAVEPDVRSVSLELDAAGETYRVELGERDP